MIFFNIEGYELLSQKICQGLKGTSGELEIKTFPNKEKYTRIITPVRNLDVVLVGGTIDDSATLQIFDLASGLVTEGCRSLKILIPFFGYSTMERAVRPGEVVTAKTRARLLSAIPTAPYGTEICLMDLHSEGIPFYFEGLIKTQHLYAKPIIKREALRLGKQNNSSFVLGAVDAGRAKWIESLANDLQVSAGFVYKKRDVNGAVKISGTNTPVQDKDVVIYDDMIRSGNSLLQAAKAYKEAGAKDISVITTHADFTDTVVQNLKSSMLIKELICTDTHPKAFLTPDPFLKVVSVAEIFINSLKGNPYVN